MFMPDKMVSLGSSKMEPNLFTWNIGAGCDNFIEQRDTVGHNQVFEISAFKLIPIKCK